MDASGRECTAQEELEIAMGTRDDKRKNKWHFVNGLAIAIRLSDVYNKYTNQAEQSMASEYVEVGGLHLVDSLTPVVILIVLWIFFFFFTRLDPLHRGNLLFHQYF
jgi:hypothetical protein